MRLKCLWISYEFKIHIYVHTIQFNLLKHTNVAAITVSSSSWPALLGSAEQGVLFRFYLNTAQLGKKITAQSALNYLCNSCE